jgi:peroxiredoxin
VAIDNFAGMPGYTASNRAVFVVNAEGTITYAWVGPNPGVEPDYEEVKRAVTAA